MEYLWITWDQEDEYDPSETYVELDSQRLETRKVEFFQNGVCFAYGAERGNDDMLQSTPYPTDLRELGENANVRPVSRGFFAEIWNQASERPDGMFGLFY